MPGVAKATIYAAETNAVVARKLWPRSLIGPPASRADEETLVALAKVEERSDHEQIEVEFTPPGTDGPEPQAADDPPRPRATDDQPETPASGERDPGARA